MTTTAIGVVTVDHDKDTATCSAHGQLDASWRISAEGWADDHIDKNADCWADHCGGKGCKSFACICNHRSHGAADFVPDGGDHA